MAKYDPLFRHLCQTDDGPLAMTFDEIDALVTTLPNSATQRVWWTNDPSRPQARAWLNAGRDVESVDPGRRQVRFSAAGWRRGA
ncbi:MAG: hypothetical protein ABIR32_17030 [Ilumatobacteraceae bacterium]